MRVALRRATRRRAIDDGLGEGNLRAQGEHGARARGGKCRAGDDRAGTIGSIDPPWDVVGDRLVSRDWWIGCIRWRFFERFASARETKPRGRGRARANTACIRERSRGARGRGRVVWKRFSVTRCRRYRWCVRPGRRGEGRGRRARRPREPRRRRNRRRGERVGEGYRGDGRG